MKTIQKALAVTALLLTGCNWGHADPPKAVDVAGYKAPIVLSCVGDSITARGNPNGYPSQLGRMLGEGWRVENFGASGSTLMNIGGGAYQKKGPLQEALDSKPNVVIIMLGTNDSKPYAWKKSEQFVPDYKALIGKFKALDSKPRIFIAKPPYVNDGGKTTGINEANILQELPLIDQIAKEENVDVVDVHAATLGKNELFRDGVHPTSNGAGFVARVFYTALTGKEFEGKIPPAPKVEKQPEAGKN